MALPNSREVAARLVAQWLEAGDFPDRLLEGVDRDRAFVGEIVLGIARWKRALEFLLDQLAPRKPRGEVAACAYVGLYQLLYLDDVEAFAAVHETVEAAKRIAGEKTAGFINALLRRAQREEEVLRRKLDGQPDGVRFSHPDVLFDRWRANFGILNTVLLCEWNNRRADTFIRERDTGEFRKLERGQRVIDVDGYAEGEFVVQDPATMVSVKLLDVQPGHDVLDACAAPGGKTIALWDALRARGSLTAMDLHEDRLAVLRENLARAKCDGVRVEKGDAARADIPGRYDRILLDVPCSNSGVIRRRPDARWRFSQERLASLAATQRALLDNAARALKPGGKLVYSTCSLEPEENESLVSAWLDGRGEFSLESRQSSFPPESRMDGAFAALLARA